MTAPLDRAARALPTLSPEAKAAIDGLRFESIADFASTVGACAVLIGAAAERHNKVAICVRFEMLRLAATALRTKIEEMNGEQGMGP
jgi:hypothetical protein